MRKIGWQIGRAALVAMLGMVVCAIGPVRAAAQEETVYGQRQTSQAQKEADRLVSLAPEKIIEALSNEPGLLLVVKKRLVRMAYEQGRLLNEADLTDEALYRLIREDHLVRAAVTRELEERNYIRPKPTKDEIDRQRREKLAWEQMGRDLSKDPTTQTPDPNLPRVKNQEGEYWRRHEVEDTYVPPLKKEEEGGADKGVARPRYRYDEEDEDYYPDQMMPTPRSRPSTSRARDMYRADLEEPQELQRIRPEQLPDVVAAAAARGSASSRGATDLGEAEASALGLGTGGDGLSALSRQMAGQMPTDLSSLSDLRDQRDSAFSDRLGERDSSLRADARPPRESSYSRRLPKERILQPQVQPTVNPYANVPSLYDLYSQVSASKPLQPFGSELFKTYRSGLSGTTRLSMDVPAGPEYVLGPGDGLSLQMYGSTSRRVTLTVDREGRVALPEVGMVMVAGRSLGDVTRLVQTALRTQFRDVNADLSLSRLRAVRVYVVGNVRYPGPYDISALSTPLNAIFEAGGPTQQGSLRQVKHMRGKQVISEYDTYDLILRGVNAEVRPLAAGDTIVVSEMGPQVTVEGMVRRPAIYELRDEKSLAEVLQLAGGVMSTGTLRHIEIERLEAHQRRVMLSVDLPEGNGDEETNRKLGEFKVQDGDKIRIAPIVAYAQKTVYLDGHLFHPGKYGWREGMKVSDVIQSYTDLLPEPYLRHAEIIRLSPPNFAPTVIGFNLGEALEKTGADMALQPFDTVRVFSRFEFEDPPIVTVSGEVRRPGDHRTNGATRVSDAVYLAGGLRPDALVREAQVFRRTNDAKMTVMTVDLSKALNGDPSQNLLLRPKDRVIIHSDQSKVDPPTVLIQGEVPKPGKYPMSSGMTASQLIALAGGLKRSADRETADLTRYLGVQDAAASGHERVELAKALSGDGSADVELRDGDVLSIRQVTGWNDRGATITLRGEVVHPGTYGIRDGETLSAVLKRAGGLRPEAYTYGAVLQRDQVRQIEEQNRVEMLRRIELAGEMLKAMPDNPSDPYHPQSKTAAIAQWQATLEKLKVTPPTGRVVLHISSDIKRWENSSADIAVRSGDVLTIPKKPDFIMVSGAVYNPNAVTYRPGRSADWYLQQGGGPTQVAKKDAIFVVRADGSVVGGGNGLFGTGIHGTRLKPGDTVVVPEKAVGGPSHWQLIFQGAQAFSSIAVAVSYLTTQL